MTGQTDSAFLINHIKDQSLNMEMEKPLAHVGFDVSPEMADAARHFVLAKHAFDQLAKKTTTDWIVTDRLGRGHGSTANPMAFIQAIVPFINCDCIQSVVRGLVPLDRVIGESWRWTHPRQGGRSEEALCDYLTHHDRAERVDQDVAVVWYVEPLGVFASHEGKNRVAFLRDHGETTLPAEVTSLTYPAPERIRRYVIGDSDSRVQWVVLDSRWVQRARFPSLSDALLNPYGVAPPTRWPANWISPDVVEREFIRVSEDIKLRQTVDLHQLESKRERTQFNNEWVPTTWLQIDDVKLHWKNALRLLGVLAAIFLGGLFVGNGIAEAIAGVFAGLWLMLSLPLWRAKRRALTVTHASFAHRRSPAKQSDYAC